MTSIRYIRTRETLVFVPTFSQGFLLASSRVLDERRGKPCTSRQGVESFGILYAYRLDAVSHRIKERTGECGVTSDLPW